MFNYVGTVLEFHLDPGQMKIARISCSAKAIPNPGQYLLAYRLGDIQAVMADALFPSEILPDGFMVAPPVPERWQLGTKIKLRGPLGRGFRRPDASRNVGFVGFGSTIARLKPIINQFVAAKRTTVLFTDAPLADLHPEVEVHPLSAFDETPLLNVGLGAPWFDTFFVDLPLEKFSFLRGSLRRNPEGQLPSRSQVLIATPMPCGGLADCGVCAVPAPRGYKLACKDGPVFDFSEIDWQ